MVDKSFCGSELLGNWEGGVGVRRTDVVIDDRGAGVRGTGAKVLR